MYHRKWKKDYMFVFYHLIIFWTTWISAKLFNPTNNKRKKSKEMDNKTLILQALRDE